MHITTVSTRATFWKGILIIRARAHFIAAFYNFHADRSTQKLCVCYLLHSNDGYSCQLRGAFFF